MERIRVFKTGNIGLEYETDYWQLRFIFFTFDTDIIMV